MGTQLRESLQDPDGVKGGDGVMDHRGVAGNSDEPRLRQGAGCPTLLLMILKPRPSRGMVYVVGPGKSDEDVHVR
jgi:hypothetical protein